MVPSILFSEYIKEAFYKTRLILFFRILIYLDFLKYDLWMAPYEIRLTFRAITLLQKNLKAKTVCSTYVVVYGHPLMDTLPPCVNNLKPNSVIYATIWRLYF